MNAKKAKSLRKAARSIRQIELMRDEPHRLTYEAIAQRMANAYSDDVTLKQCRRAVRFTTLQANQ